MDLGEAKQVSLRMKALRKEMIAHLQENHSKLHNNTEVRKLFMFPNDLSFDRLIKMCEQVEQS